MQDGSGCLLETGINNIESRPASFKRNELAKLVDFSIEKPNSFFSGGRAAHHFTQSSFDDASMTSGRGGNVRKACFMIANVHKRDGPRGNLQNHEGALPRLM